MLLAPQCMSLSHLRGDLSVQYTATARSKKAAEHAASMEALAALAAAGQLGRPLALEVMRMQSGNMMQVEQRCFCAVMAAFLRLTCRPCSSAYQPSSLLCR